jgi:acetolactate synthase-1/3 small subunit
MNTPEAPERLRVLTAVVEDQPGVLTRVAGMIRRRGFNIQGLSVGPTDEAGRSRMTLSVDAGHAEVDQVQKQLDRLVEVIDVQDLTDEPKLSRELALVKLAVTGPQRDQAVTDVERAGGHVVDADEAQMIVELAGEFERVERFLDALRPYRVLDVARSGPVAMSKGVISHEQ